MSYGLFDATLRASEAFAAAFNSTALNLDYARGYCLFAVNTVANSTARTFVDGGVVVGTDTITLDAAHGWVTGRKVAATTSGVLPAGLSATDYYVIVVTSTSIQLASSLANAQAGTAVDITAAAGGGTHTLTPTALATASLKLQGSLDGTNYFDIANTSTNITATANIMWNVDAPYYRYVRAVSAIAAGQILCEIKYRVLRYGRAR